MMNIEMVVTAMMNIEMVATAMMKLVEGSNNDYV